MGGGWVVHIKEDQKLELSIIMPCLNEERTVGYCVDEARQFMDEHHINGEIIVVDNASEDVSATVALEHGAKVITEKRKGYGSAIRTGIANSTGKVLIIGDADTTYDFGHLEEMYQPLANGIFDMVIGNRYAGGFEKGAMPWTHKWGVKFLSYCGRKRFGVEVYDFHCGLRAVTRQAVEQLSFHTEGMEFATEMIAEAAKKNLRIKQVPVHLRKCEYARKSKLRTIRDGFRHLRYIFIQEQSEFFKK